MVRFLLALAAFHFVPTGAASAGDDGGTQPQRFAYHPSVLQEMGPALPPEVVPGPVIDRRRAYLLDISEEEFAGPQKPLIRNVWDRIRNGYALPPLRGPLVADVFRVPRGQHAHKK